MFFLDLKYKLEKDIRFRNRILTELVIITPCTALGIVSLYLIFS